MKKLTILLAAAAMVLAGCEKVNNAIESVNDKSDAIYVSFADFNTSATKVTADDISAETVSFSWESGDKICFYVEGEEDIEEYCEYVCTDTETGKFEKADEEQPDLDPETEYSVVYPAMSEIEFDEDTDAMIETYRENDVTKTHMLVSSAMGDEESITLFHCPIVHLQLIGDATVGSIKYYSILEGQFASVDLETIQTCGENGVTLDADKATDFYISANGAASDGFKIEICDLDGEVISTKTSSIDLTDDSSYNTIFDMPVIDISLR